MVVSEKRVTTRENKSLTNHSSKTKTKMTKKNDKNQEEEDRDQRYVDRGYVPLRAFPPPPSGRYLLHRVNGLDILSNIDENNSHHLEGALEVNNDQSSAMIYVKFPNNKGILAGRLDSVEEIDNGRHSPTYFTATFCKAHIDYGVWEGVIHRHEDMIGAPFRGSIAFFGLHGASVGSPDEDDVSADKPFVVDTVHSVRVIHNEQDAIDPTEELPEGFEPLKSGYLGFTLFFDNSDDPRGVSIPLTLWFKPISTDGEEQNPNDKRNTNSRIIPESIVKEIGKLKVENDGDDNKDDNDDGGNDSGNANANSKKEKQKEKDKKRPGIAEKDAARDLLTKKKKKKTKK